MSDKMQKLWSDMHNNPSGAESQIQYAVPRNRDPRRYKCSLHNYRMGFWNFGPTNSPVTALVLKLVLFSRQL